MGQQGWDPRGQVYGVLIPGQPWQQVGEAYQSAASPAADKDGTVFFADPRAGKIYKSTPDGHVTLFNEHANGATALRFGADGMLYASQPAAKRIVAYSAGGEEKIVAHDVTANDLAVTAKNDIYFVDTMRKTLGLLRAGSAKPAMFSLPDMTTPAVLTLSPDQAMIDVGDAQSRFNWSFQIAADGAPINGEPFFRVDMTELSPASQVAGATVDSIGQVYFATGLGIQFCEQNGRCAGILSKPELSGAVSDVAFGGPERNWLYVAQNGKIFRREVESKGVTAWQPVMPPRPPL
jgi:sugar lactone lactonase YvrE